MIKRAKGFVIFTDNKYHCRALHFLCIIINMWWSNSTCQEREMWKTHVKQKRYPPALGEHTYTYTYQTGGNTGKAEARNFGFLRCRHWLVEAEIPELLGKLRANRDTQNRHRPRDASHIQTPSVSPLIYGQINSRQFLCEEKSVSISIEKRNFQRNRV
jgi:hypothetical protein